MCVKRRSFLTWLLPELTNKYAIRCSPALPQRRSIYSIQCRCNLISLIRIRDSTKCCISALHQGRKKYFNTFCISALPRVSSTYSERCLLSGILQDQGRHSKRSYSSKQQPPRFSVEESLHMLYDRLLSLENATRVRGYSTIKPGLVLLVVSIGFGVYLLRDHIRRNVADEVTHVATKSLGDQTLQVKAQELAVALLYTIYNDPNMQHKTVMFLKSILHRPDTQQALIDLLLDTFQNENIKHQLLVLLKKAIIDALSDPKFRAYLGENLLLLLSDKNLQAGVAELLNALLQDDTVNEAAQVFIREILKSQPVATEVTQLGKSVVEGVVNDPDVQKKTGDGLWSALGYTVTPRWFGKKPSAPQEVNKMQTKQDVKNTGNNATKESSNGVSDSVDLVVEDLINNGEKDTISENNRLEHNVKNDLVVTTDTEVSEKTEAMVTTINNDDKKAVTTHNGDM